MGEFNGPSKLSRNTEVRLSGSTLVEWTCDWCAQCPPGESSIYIAEKLERAAVVMREKFADSQKAKNGTIVR